MMIEEANESKNKRKIKSNKISEVIIEKQYANKQGKQ